MQTEHTTRVTAAHEDALRAAHARSHDALLPWIPPYDAAGVARVIAQSEAYAAGPGGRACTFVTVGPDDIIRAQVNVSEIVRGSFHSAYLGLMTFAPYQGQGVMRRTLTRVITRAFAPPSAGGLGLHRLEANIQPDNAPSLGLVARLGFRKEGYSPRYLHIGGAWRDHVRTAITAEDWHQSST